MIGVRSSSGRARAVVLAVGASLLLAGCGMAMAASHEAEGVPGAAPGAAPAATIRITPADRSGQLPPRSHVGVESTDGALQHVDLIDPTGRYLSGQFNSDHTGWTSDEPLTPGQNFVVDATAVDAAGRATELRSPVDTAALPAADSLRIASVTPSLGRQVGIAYPLIINFDHPVRNRKAVSDAMQVETFPRVEGAWYWMDPQTVDYRPENFWAPGTLVTLHANLDGVQAGDDLWGAANTTSAFTVARGQIIHVDLAADRMSVQRDGSTIGSYPVSAGKPGWRTRDGVMTIMEKVTDKTWTNTAIDAPERYLLHSKYAMRITDSGEFIHDAPWNRGKIGATNASHGCVGMLSADMAELFAQTMVGDAVIVSGSGRPFGPVTNRIGDWNVPWAQWVTGNYDLSAH
jgi:lipoprotein-anchoring transpeptidase ErfK/SrfK